MGFFGFFGKKAGASGVSASRSALCVVDVASMLGPSAARNGGRIHPRDNFLMLKNLAQFSDREEVPMIAVVTGKELKEVQEGRSFKGVTVYYADDTNAVHTKTLGAARKNASKNPVIVTSDAGLEKKAADSGFACMRPGTIRKAGMPEENLQNSRQKSNGGGQKRKNDRRRKKQEQPPQQEQQSQQSDVEDPEILSLIDPV